jgi:UPF0271 protein
MGARVQFVKAHGALYHAACEVGAIADALVAGAAEALGAGVTVIGSSQGALAHAAGQLGVEFAREGFADRAVRPDGKLVPRDEPGALVLEPSLAAKRARELSQRGDIDTVCVHGDTPGSVAIARAVRAALEEHRGP